MEENNERSVEIVPFGTDERIKLNVGMIQKMIAVPTKSGHIADAVACMKFMMLCKSRHLNPWEGDAYLIGYDTHTGPQFSLITAHQVFLKRAESSQNFDGIESGVIVDASAVEDGGIFEREGDLTYDGEKLLGGWAKVYRKDLGRPIYKRIKLQTFNTGRSRWEKDPAGMIVKCAEADALRTAFPTHLGGLYMREELEPIDITPKNGEGIKFGPALPAPAVESTTLPDGSVINVIHEPESEQPEPLPQRRKRRTKAEMEAARASVEPPPTPSEEAWQKVVEPDVASAPKPEPPARATQLEGLRNLINATPITEFMLENWCRRKGMLEPHHNLSNLTPDNMAEVTRDFHTIANSIADGTYLHDES